MTQRRLDTMLHAEFGRLFTRYKDPFVKIAYSYINDMMAAEDLVTDSFLAFWDKHNDLPDDTNIPAYILTTVRNKCLNWLQTQKIHLKIEQNVHAMQQRMIEANIRSLEVCDPQKLFVDEITQTIDASLEAMPERTRKIFRARRDEDKTYREIAIESGLSIRQVEYEFRKAEKALQSALKDYLPALILMVIMNSLYK